MADAGDLQKLPQELRNAIYGLVLINPSGFKLKSYQAGGQHVAAPAGHRRNAKHRRQEWRGGRWLEIPSKNALAQVNKQLQAETSPILYGANDFEFHSTKALEWFLAQIGDNKEHLRNLILGWPELRARALPAEQRAIKALLASTNIRTLGIVCDCYYYLNNKSEYVQKFAEMCVPLLRSLGKSFQAKNLNANVLDVLKVISHDHSVNVCRSRRLQCSHITCIIWRARFEERFDLLAADMKKEAARQLNIEYQ